MEIVNESLEVKCCQCQDGGDEIFILCRSRDRRQKEQAIYERFEKRFEEGLQREAFEKNVVKTFSVFALKITFLPLNCGNWADGPVFKAYKSTGIPYVIIMSDGAIQNAHIGSGAEPEVLEKYFKDMITAALEK